MNSSLLESLGLRLEKLRPNPSGDSWEWNLLTADGEEAACLWLADRSDSGTPLVSIILIEVKEQWQRKGLASWLMQAVEQHFPGVTISHGPRSPQGRQWAEAYYGHQSTYTLDGQPCDIFGKLLQPA